MTHVIGTSKCTQDGFITAVPSTAERTDIAGVIKPSPNKKAVPSKRAKKMVYSPWCCGRRNFRGRSEKRVRTPPSPLFSARNTNTRYLMETTIIRDQKMSEATPKIAVTPDWPSLTDCWKAYKGLVPMSPKTTPSANKARIGVGVFRFKIYLSSTISIDDQSSRHTHFQVTTGRTAIKSCFCCSSRFTCRNLLMAQSPIGILTIDINHHWRSTRHYFGAAILQIPDFFFAFQPRQ